MAKAKKSILDSTGETPNIIEFDYKNSHYCEEEGVVAIEDMNPNDVRHALNRAPAKYIYWRRLLADVKKEIEINEAKFEMWYAKKYAQASETYPKGTEGYKKNQVIINNAAEYKIFLKRRAELNFVEHQTRTLCDSFKMQAETMRSISNSLNKEMDLTGT